MLTDIKVVLFIFDNELVIRKSLIDYGETFEFIFNDKLLDLSIS